MKKLSIVLGLALMFAMPAMAQKKPSHQNQPSHLSRPAQQSRPAKQAPARQTQQSRKENQNTQHTRNLQARANESGRSRGSERLAPRNDRRMSDDQFRGNFGRDHSFRVNIGMYGGYSGFMYGGFQFGFLEPWPMGWGYDDPCYIDYIDGGYFLFDPLFPGTRIAVVIN
jgi:hypothetical protein